MTSDRRLDVHRTVLSVAMIAGLIALSVWVLRPFLPALVWATMIVVATWPLLLGAQKRLGGRRWMAVTLLTVLMLVVFLLPLLLAIKTVVAHVDDIADWASAFDAESLKTPPSWVAGLPLVGERLDTAWREAAASGRFGQTLRPYLGAVGAWLAATIGGFGAVLLQFLLTVALAAVLYSQGEAAARLVLRFASRVGDDEAERAVLLAGKAIRGVAMGVVVTALVQSIFGGIGLAVAGVPLAGLLTAVMFLLAVAQIGAVPVLACAVVWLYWRGDTGWGTALLVWTVIVGSMDNVLRPILIKRGANLPLLLVFAGVVGGLIAFGMVGLFIGPMVLAVTWTLAQAWVEREEPA
ncbi:MAG TPA: AI-2E family transporter YdiK [Planctomycetota bacterium]|nr:AI-2E family transporter YdiK [Planctomycetota bacterium]